MIGVDSSVAAKWLFPEEEHADKAQALLDDAVKAREVIVAPPLLTSEITNIIRQRIGRGAITLEEGEWLFTRLLATPLTIVSPPDLPLEALRTAVRHNLPATYDAHYVALSQMVGATLWTDDQRLLRLLAGKLPHVSWIGDYQRGGAT